MKGGLVRRIWYCTYTLLGPDHVFDSSYYHFDHQSVERLLQLFFTTLVDEVEAYEASHVLAHT